MIDRNPDNLPAIRPCFALAVIPRISMTDFLMRCRQRPYSKIPFYEGDSTGCKPFNNLKFKPETHETIFQYHRVLQGSFTQASIAEYMEMPLTDYIDVEEGEMPPTGQFIKNFCSFMDLHPADLIVETTDAMDEALFYIMLECYQLYKDQENLMDGEVDAINTQKINEMSIALDYEADLYNSYTELTNSQWELEGEDDISNNLLKSFVNKLVVNDGNRNLFVGDMVEIANQAIKKSFDSCQKALTESINSRKQAIEDRNALGTDILGENLDGFLNLVDVEYHHKTRDSFESFFCNYVSSLNPNATKQQTTDFLNLYRQEKMLESYQKPLVSKMVREKDVRAKFDEFFEDNKEVLKFYSHRQIILNRFPELCSIPNGIEENPAYIVAAVKSPFSAISLKPR